MTYRWNKPPVGWYKCNADGAFSAADNTGATGVALRDHDGRFLAGRAAWHGRRTDALMMEALACRDGLLLARQCGVSKLYLETDCMVLVNLWEAMDDQRSAINLILHDIRDISRSFDEFTFAFANRDCNRVAHLCARQVPGDRVMEEWHRNPPLAIRELLAEDFSSETILSMKLLPSQKKKTNLIFNVLFS
jgi:ribonuclease HI